MARLIIRADRESYGKDDVRTMTVGELIAFLEEFDEDAQVILSHDNGYTYGGLRTSSFYEDEEEED